MDKILITTVKSVLIACSILFTACVKDVYELEQPVPEVPDANIDWSTNQTSKLTVNLADEYDGKYYYTVEAFMGNPAIDENAQLITGSGQKVNSKTPYSREIVIPEAINTIYICITDPFKRKAVYGLDVQEGDMNINIGNTNQVKSAQLRAMESQLPAVDYSYKESECIILSGNNNVTLEKGKAYLIKAGSTFSGDLTFPGEGNISIYVAGTWEWKNNNVQLESGISIFVLNDAKVVKSSGDGKLSLIGSAKIAIQKEGKLGDDANNNKFSFYMTGTSQIINEGNAYAKNIEMDSQAKIYNGDEFKADKITTQNEGNKIVNLHKFETDQISLTNGVIDNYCKFVVKNHLTSPANGKINLAPYSYMNVKQLTSEGGLTLFMDAKSLWVGEHALFNGSNNYVKGGNTDYALFRVDMVRVAQYAGLVLKYQDKIEIECAAHQSNPDKWNECYKLSDGARMTIGLSTIEIPKSDCNGNTGNTPPPTGDGDNEGSYEEGETVPYTYMFEDNWPSQGDYDMNDLVMTVEIRNTTNGQKTTKAKIIYTLQAVGGIKKLAAAFQLDGIPANAVAGTEAGQSNAVVKLFDNAHATLGVTTGKITNTFTLDCPPKTFEKEIIFNQPIDKVINASNFNLFIVWGGMEAAKWNEIHIAGFKGTNKAITHANSTENYTAKDNGWMWGLSIAQIDAATYPKEGISINKAYTDFDKWLMGDQTPDWYNKPIEKSVMFIDEQDNK